MSKKYPLSKTKNFQTSLLFWTKEYLAFKALELFQKSKQNKVDDIIVSKDAILNAQTIAEIKNACNTLIQKELRSLSKHLGGAVSFFEYISKATDSFSAIDTECMHNYTRSLTVAASTKKNHADVALELLTYIENCNTDGFKFNIEYEAARAPKAKAKAYDAMDAEEFIRFSKEITKCKAKTEFERCRNILMCRILLYSGITPKELVHLKLGESLVVESKSMYLKLDNRSVLLYLPRNKLIKYFNQYQELKEESTHDYFFYGSSNPNEMLDTKKVNEIVKTMLRAAKIERREMNATLLRVSLAVYLYNYRKDGKQFSLASIQQIMGHKNRSDTENMIGFHAKECVNISDVFLEEEFSYKI